ncbi:MAG: transcription antitermination factor NusB [Deltaproteobacteria bacterium]
MGQRRKARNLALQVLYQVDLTQDGLDQSMKLLWDQLELSEDVRGFAEERVKGVRENLDEIDELIRRASEHWRIERMSAVDRNILRLAVYELAFRPEVPERVVINEAIELGKRFFSCDVLRRRLEIAAINDPELFGQEQG